MKRTSSLAFLILLVMFGAACGNDNPTVPVTPPEPEPVPTVTETFMGALGLGGSSCHFFDVAQAGPVTMSVTALAPLETLTVGLGVGLPDDSVESGCGLIVADTSVRKDESFLASVNTVGSHCVCVFDVGNIFAGQNVTYTLDVEHP
jgi:hypothetical protein